MANHDLSGPDDAKAHASLQRRRNESYGKQKAVAFDPLDTLTDRETRVGRATQEAHDRIHKAYLALTRVIEKEAANVILAKYADEVGEMFLQFQAMVGTRGLP